MAARRFFSEIHKAQVCAILGIGCKRRIAARYVRFPLATIRQAALRDPEFGRQLRQAEQLPRMRLVRALARRRSRGRPLDDEAQKELLAILKLGCSRAAAAYFIGCDPTAIDELAKSDEAFLAKLHHAESSDEVGLVKRIKDASVLPQYWRAAAWSLERKYPDRFSVRQPHTLTIAELRPIVRQFADLVMQEVKSRVVRRRIRCRMHALLKDMETLARANR